MSDFKSTIHIEDDFSGTLKELTKLSFTSMNAVNAFSESLKELDKDKLKDSLSSALQYAADQNDIADKLVRRATNYTSKLADNLKKQVQAIPNKLKELSGKMSIRVSELNKSFSETASKYKWDAAFKLSEFKEFTTTLPMRMKELNKDFINKANSFKWDLSMKIGEFKKSELGMKLADFNKSFIEKAKMLKWDIDLKFGEFKSELPHMLKEFNDAFIDKVHSLDWKIDLELGKIKDLGIPTYLEEVRKSLINNVNGLNFDLNLKFGSPEEIFANISEKISGFTSSAADKFDSLKMDAMVKFNEIKLSFKEKMESLSEIMNKVKDKIVDKLRMLSASIKQIPDRLKDIKKDLINKAEGIKFDLKLKLSEHSELIKDLKDFATSFAKDAIKMVGLAVISELAKKMSKILIDKMKQVGEALVNSIDKSLNEININDKFKSMFGEAGNSADNRAYALANELGENSSMVREMSIKAAYQGIGTDDFERVMKLSDKIGKLSLSETTESAANNLISNIKSGHDASSISQMLGGGEVLERKLKRAGYERALNRGDISKALDIAERITEEAGLTDEKYKQATNSMSENWKSILNVIDNIKHRLGEIFNRQLEPVVKSIKDVVDSKGFKFMVSVAETVIEKIGSVISNILTGLNWMFTGLMDNIELIGALLGTFVVAKTLFIVNKGISMVHNATALLDTAKKVAEFLKLDVLYHKIINSEKVKAFMLEKGISKEKLLQYIRTKLIAGIKILGVVTAVAAAVTAVTYGVYKLSGASKSFGGWVLGNAAAIYQYLMNVFTNIFIFFDRTVDKGKILGLRIKQGFFALIGVVKSKVGELIAWILQKFYDLIDDSPLGELLEKAGIGIGSFKEAVIASRNAAMNLGSDDFKRANEVEKAIQDIVQHQMQYIDVTEGVLEAYNSEGATVKAYLGKMLKSLVKQEDTTKKVESDTSKIRKMNEQEEELRWLKAFSDRQIMHAYGGDTTNNSSVINVGSLSEQSKKEIVRKYKTRPGRGAA